MKKTVKQLKPVKNGPKFTELERERVLELVAFYDRQGKNQTQISKLIGVSQVMVWKYLKTIKERYKAEQLEERGALVNTKLHQYRDIRSKAWDALSEAEKEQVKTSYEEFTNGSGDTSTKKGVVKQQLLPPSEYLRVVMETLKAERELLGLDAPVKTAMDLKAQIVTIPWDELAKVVNQEPPPVTVVPESVKTLPSPTPIVTPEDSDQAFGVV